ncbi:MAG: discoidin domain-containing protein, partial [Chthoniobacterales bacterium]
IQSFAVNWEHASGKTYTIDVSPDGSSWTTVATELNCPAGPVTRTYTAPGGTTAKYVRLVGTTRNTTFSYSPFEFEVYGIPGNTGTDPVPVVSNASKTGAIGNNFTYTIVATNKPTSYNATGLPNGLSINQSSGLITGTPTQQGTFNVTLTAVNENGAGTGTLSLFVEPQPTAPPVITSSLTSTATILQPYTYQITSTGGAASYAATNLPSGLVLDQATGLISGSSIVQGSFNVALTATNNIGTSTPVTLVLTVDTGGTINLSRIAGAVLTASTVNGGNTAPMAADGNTTVTRWESVQGATADPSWIQVNFGQPCTIKFAILTWEAASGKTYTLEVSDNGTTWTTVATEPNNPGAGTKTYAINATGQYLRMYGTSRNLNYGYSMYEFQVFGNTGVGAVAPVINSPLTASGAAGTPFNYQITASGSPTSFNATGLPNGLAINTGTGAITGTPTAGGTSNISISATNANGTDTKTLVLTVSAPPTNPPVINSALTANGATGAAFSYQITATNSPTSFQALNLPNGLAINGSGLITGTPTVAGTSNITIKATNGIGTDTKTLVLTVASAPSNLSVGKTDVTASGNEAGNLIPNGNDASLATRWAAANGNYPQWWRVNLGAKKALSRVDIKWYGGTGRSYKYKIETSNDDVNYTMVVDKTANTTTDFTTDNTTVQAQYVRITVTGTTQGFASFYDCSVFGFNLAAPPVISSSLTASATMGNPFVYQIAASGNPTSYNATGLPAGLAINTGTGAITGTPTGSGTSNVSISATNAGGTDTKTLVLTVDTPLAVNMPATASTSQPSNVAASANDGSSTTRWSASTAAWPQTWSVDLGIVKAVTRVEISWYSGATRAYKYKIETSTDGTNYTLAVDKTANKTFGNSADNFTANARFVRITATGCSAGGAIASFYEVNIVGH